MKTYKVLLVDKKKGYLSTINITQNSLKEALATLHTLYNNYRVRSIVEVPFDECRGDLE